MEDLTTLSEDALIQRTIALKGQIEKIRDQRRAIKDELIRRELLRHLTPDQLAAVKRLILTPAPATLVVKTG